MYDSGKPDQSMSMNNHSGNSKAEKIVLCRDINFGISMSDLALCYVFVVNWLCLLGGPMHVSQWLKSLHPGDLTKSTIRHDSYNVNSDQSIVTLFDLQVVVCIGFPQKFPVQSLSSSVKYNISQ